jgi:hypothetical protein
MEIGLDALADAYLRNHRNPDKNAEFWAWEDVHDLVKTDLDAAWTVTLLLLDKASSDDEVGYIAAGPLEDLIDLYGHKALDLIEEVAEKNGRLQLALSTVGILFYYEEFERWYGLLYKYGFRKDRVADSSVIAEVMKTMRSYLDESINVYEYGCRMTEMLDKPLDDKAAQRILRQRCEDIELLNAKRPPDYQKPYITKPEVKQRATEAMAELESLGYQAGA